MKRTKVFRLVMILLIYKKNHHAPVTRLVEVYWVKRAKSTCKHIVYVVMNMFHISETSSILEQVAFTKNEREFILSNFEHVTEDNEEIEIQPEIQ